MVDENRDPSATQMPESFWFADSADVPPAATMLLNSQNKPMVIRPRLETRRYTVLQMMRRPR